MMTTRLAGLCLIGALTYASAPASAGKGGDSYAYLSNGGSITMSGDTKDLARVRSYQQGSGPLLWFREGGKEYLVRDPDTLAQLDAIWKPGRELDAEEAKLDRQHDGLDARHDQLDSQREAVESRREALADREAELADREADASPAARADLAKQRRELQRQQQALAGELRAFDQPMKELRTQMDALRRQLDALRPKQQLASSKEDAAVRALVHRAIAAGTATPVR